MAQPDHPSADAVQLERYLRRATGRIRLERLRHAFGVVLWLFLACATFWTASLLWHPEWALGAPFGVSAIVLGLFVTVDIAWFWHIDRRRVLLRLDRQLGLADAAISASELSNENGDAWRRRQLTQTLRELADRPWGARWPHRWPRLIWMPILTLGLLCWLLIQAYFVEKAGAQPPISPFQQAQFQALESVFKDWDEAAKKFDDPELRARLDELKPLREKILAGQLEEKDVLAALSRVEDRLEAARKSLDAHSLEPSAAELASAVEPFQGMSALAAALRRKDFGQSEKLANDLAKQLAQPDAKLPEGSHQPENQQRLANTANTMEQRGQKPTADALREMEQGMKEGSPSQMGQGMQDLKKGLGDQAKRDGEKQRLNTQLAQMKDSKDSMGSGKSVARAMSLLPKLSTQKGPPGSGAGSEIDPNRFGAETNLAAHRSDEKLTGEASEGDSIVTTQKSDQHAPETIAGARAASFKEYERLSREAVEDESIPLAHRQAIRRYFEMIRPAEK